LNATPGRLPWGTEVVDFRIAWAAESGDLTTMKQMFLAFAAGAGVLLSGWAQNVGPGGANGRGGISFVTRRLPTSGVGGSAGSSLAASGVSVANATAGGGTTTVGGTVGATAAVDFRPTLDGKSLAALRQLAGRGDREAQRLLRESGQPIRPARR